MTDEQLKAIRERRQSARRWQLRQDIAALLAEVERLSANIAVLDEVLAHHVAARGLVEHGPLLVTHAEKKILVDAEDRSVKGRTP